MTFYLKYRPQTFEELDLTSVRESLKKIVQGNVPHAFLFSGPKGTGKTSAARILAKAINCTHRGKGVEPCNECDSCVSITKGTNVDVVEMDAASHRGIDDVRSLREAVKLAPAKLDKKVYIIDEAHMLTTEASNALLKTLEEPPDHVVFILATTNSEKLISTIRSRVTIINFAKASKEESLRSLKRVANGEKIKIDDETLSVIYKHADGAFRDAVKIFEQLVSEKVELNKSGVASFLEKSSAFNIEDFLEFLSKKDAAKLLLLLNEAIKKGASAKNLTQNLIGNLRTELINRVSKNEGKFSLENSEIIELIQILTSSIHDISVSTLEQIPLELVIIDWCEKGGNERENEKEYENEDEKLAKEKKLNEVRSEKLEVRSKNRGNEIVVEVTDESKEENILKQSEISDEVWSKILFMIRTKNASTEALLRAARPVSFDGKIVTLAVYYSFHKEKLESSPHRNLLEDALSEILGTSARIFCKLAEPPIKNVVAKSESGPVNTVNEKIGVTDVVLTEEKDDEVIRIAKEIFSN